MCLCLVFNRWWFYATNYLQVHVYHGKYMFIPDDARSFDSNTTGITIGPGTANSSGAPYLFSVFFWRSHCSVFRFMCSVLWIICCLLFVFFLISVILRCPSGFGFWLPMRYHKASIKMTMKITYLLHRNIPVSTANEIRFPSNKLFQTMFF